MDISDEFRELYDAAVAVWADVDIAIQGLKDDEVVCCKRGLNPIFYGMYV